MCRAFTPDCGYAKSTIILIGDVYCPNTKCSGKLYLLKKTFQSLGRSDYQCLQCASVCQERKIPFEYQTNSFFFSFGRGVYTFDESPKSIQNVSGDVFCPSKFSLNREKCQSLDGYVTAPRYIYGCVKLWSLVVCSQSCFHVTSARKYHKNGQTTLFLCPKKMNLVPKKQLLVIAPFQSTKYRKKDLCVDSKVQETIGDVFCSTCRNEKCVYIPTNKTTSFYDSKKCQACCHILNNPFKDQKLTITLFGGNDTSCFASKTSRDYEKEKPFAILMKFLRQSQPSTSEPEPTEVLPFMA